MRQGSRRFVLCLMARLVCAGAVLATAGEGRAQQPGVDPAASAWATGGVSATAAPGATDGKAGGPSGTPRYWEVPPLPAAVIQGGAIPAGWQPQPIPYQGVGPDGRPVTTYVAPTYVFTYQSGPPVLAVPSAARGVNRRQAAGYGYGYAAPTPVVSGGTYPAGYPGGWNYATSGAPPPAPTVARYAPPYQYPPNAPQLAGTPIVPPAAVPAAAAAAAVPVFVPAPAAGGPVSGPSSRSIAPPPEQWMPSAEPPPPGAPVAAIQPPPAPVPAAPPIAPVPASSPAAPVGMVPIDAAAAPQPLGGAAAPSAPGSNTHLWRVVGVHDGDTVTCLDEQNQQQKIRLAEIDAPEVSQDFGKVSREALAGLVFGKTVQVVDDGRDRYGRWIGHLFVDGVDVNRQMVATGNAWHYAAYSKDSSLASLETQARSRQLGLWAQPNPTPPWDYRKNGKKS